MGPRAQVGGAVGRVEGRRWLSGVCCRGEAALPVYLLLPSERHLFTQPAPSHSSTSPHAGKTLLARAVANRTDACFIRVIGSELVQKYVGEGARMVSGL